MTRLIKATKKNIKASAVIIKNGGLAVYPTETVYGLGCDPFNAKAVEKLRQVKAGRTKPFPILSCSLTYVEAVAEVSSRTRSIIEKFWPGPLTLVLPRKRSCLNMAFGVASVAVRIPNNKVALELIELSGGFLAGTSANKTGRSPAVTAVEAYEQLRGGVDVILDGGRSRLGVSSTVVDLTCEKPRVLRGDASAFKHAYPNNT